MARNPSPNDNPNDAYPLDPHKSDTEPLPTPVSGIAFSGAGALHVLTEAGIERTIPSGVLAAGVVHPLRITQLYDSGTSVTDPVGFTNVGPTE